MNDIWYIDGVQNIIHKDIHGLLVLAPGHKSGFFSYDLEVRTGPSPGPLGRVRERCDRPAAELREKEKPPKGGFSSL